MSFTSGFLLGFFLSIIFCMVLDYSKKKTPKIPTGWVWKFSKTDEGWARFELWDTLENKFITSTCYAPEKQPPWLTVYGRAACASSARDKIEKHLAEVNWEINLAKWHNP